MQSHITETHYIPTVTLLLYRLCFVLFHFIHILTLSLFFPLDLNFSFFPSSFPHFTFNLILFPVHRCQRSLATGWRPQINSRQGQIYFSSPAPRSDRLCSVQPRAQPQWLRTVTVWNLLLSSWPKVFAGGIQCKTSVFGYEPDRILVVQRLSKHCRYHPQLGILTMFTETLDKSQYSTFRKAL
jgi:hypothetical protein